MPLGAARLNTLAKFQAPAGPVRTQYTITPVNDTQVDTAQYQFGGASALFDGTGDYMQVADGSTYDLFAFGTNDWTIEMWIRPAVSGTVRYLLDARNAAGSVAVAIVWQLRNDNKLYAYANGSFWATSSGTISANTWTHIALVRDGDALRQYINGTEDGGRTGIALANFIDNQGLFGTYHAKTAAFWNGHMDEIRISDTARYSGSSFTVPTSAFTNDSDTRFLMHANGTDGSTTFIDDAF